MPLRIISSQIVGKPDSSGWTHLYEQGELYILFSTRGNSQAGSFLPKTIFSKIQSIYASSHGDPIERIKKGLEEVLTIDPDGDLAVISLVSEKLSCVGVGNIRVVLLRNGMSATLLDSRKGNAPISVSGRMNSGDIAIAGTQAFFDALSSDQVRTVVPAHTIESLPDVLMSTLEKKSETGCIGGIFLKLGQEEIVPELPEITSEEAETTQEALVQHETATDFLERKPLYVRSEILPTKKRTPILLGLFLVLFLVGTIFWGNGKREERLKKTEFENEVASIEAKLEESVSLAHINPEASRTLFQETQNAVLGLSTEIDPGKKDELTAKLKDFQKEILGERPVDLTLFVDLALLSDGFVSGGVVVDINTAYILDNENKKLASVSLSSKRAEIVAGPALLEDVYGITAYADNVYGLTEDGIFEIDSERTIIQDGWKNALFYAYASNIYVVDRESSTIYRYTRGESGFSEKASWLNDGITAELTESKQMIIDGSIWVLKNDGTILRFTNGTYWEFTPQNVYPTVTSVSSIYTDSESENVYLLEREGRRIVVLTKQGEFVTQYNSDEFANVQFITASEADQKLFVFTEDKVYSMELGES